MRDALIFGIEKVWKCGNWIKDETVIKISSINESSFEEYVIQQFYNNEFYFFSCFGTNIEGKSPLGTFYWRNRKLQYVFNQQNRQWTFQIFSELYKYTHASEIEVNYKFNALVALKVLLNTCEFPVILCTEVYFLPHIRKVATFQIHLPQKQKGLTYFTNLGYPATQQNKKYGYNYVRLASQIISLMSRVKPWRLFRYQQISQPSQFACSLDILKAYQWKDYQMLAFYSQDDEHILREKFLNKLQNFPLKSHKYYQFFECYLDRLIRKQYSPKGIDPRKILQSCQIWACEMVLQTLKEILKERKASVKTNVIKLITEFIRFGYIKAFYIIEKEDIFGDLLEMIRSSYSKKNNHRKGYAFRSLEGSQQQRKNLHKQLVRCLQVWAVCIPKNPVKLTQQSRSSALYRQFLVQLKIGNPQGNFKKLRDQCQSNLEKNKLINHLIMKEMQINFDATKLRRTSSNLQQLFNIDQNFLSLSSFKSFITSQFLSSWQAFSQQQNSFSDSEQDSKSNHSITKSEAPCTSARTKDRPTFLAPPSSSMVNRKPSATQLPLRSKRYEQENYSGEIDEDVSTKNTNKPFFKMNKTSKPKESRSPNEQKVQFFDAHQFNFESPKNILIKKTQSKDQISIQIRTPVKKVSSKKQISVPLTIQSTIFENHIKKLLKRNAQLESALMLKDIEIQILRAKQNTRNQSTSSSWNATSTAPVCRQATSVPCLGEFYKEYLLGVKQLSLKNVFRNKGLLVKTEEIEIGFIIESAGDGSAKIQLYITPAHNLKNMQFQIKDPSNIIQQYRKDKLQQIPLLKQRKLIFKCKVNRFPYYLPKLSLKYTIDKVQQKHYILLPITPNKLISFKSDLKMMNSSIRLQTSQFSAKYSDVNQIQSLIPELKQLKNAEKMKTYAGCAEIFGSRYNIYIKMDKNKIHLQGQYEVDNHYKQRRQQLQFFLVSLLQILTK